MGLQIVVEMKISSLEAYGNSMLVINQLLTHDEVRMDDLIPYHQMAAQLLERFDFVTLEHVPRKDNQMAYALANLPATLALTKDEAVNLPVCQRWVVPLTLRASQEGVNVISVLSIDVDDWRQPLIDYLEHGKLPNDSRHRSEMLGRRRCIQSNGGGSLRYLWSSSIRAKATFPNKKDELLLADDGQELLGLCEEMPSMSILCQLYTSAAGAATSYNYFMAI
ncbi:unnamed protein product [Prunus armeniaca]|uniref:RNase H type-1 domain-containing protein n=1 Tax=Prunus armeniaca TaxID=36596 RepID=A0A6J5Y2X3_PRUAR|nr:unnamed protein product [Prunus armeniaca]